MKGHLKKTAFILTVYSYLLIGVFACSSNRAPFIVHQRTITLVKSPTSSISYAWKLDSLSPSEETVLLKRRSTPIAVYMEASGEGEYILQCLVNKNRLRPYKLKLTGPGLTEMSGRICWYIKPKYKFVTITVALYRIDTDKYGITEMTTLLKQIRRKYYVIHSKQYTNK
jgi:hypothetical protein